MSQGFPFNHFLNLQENSTEIVNNNEDLSGLLTPVKKTEVQQNGQGFPNQTELNTKDADNIIEAAMQQVQESVGTQKYSMFFENLRLKSFGSEVTLMAPTSFVKQTIDENYAQTISNAIKGVLGKEVPVSIVLNEAKNTKNPKSANQVSFSLTTALNSNNQKTSEVKKEEVKSSNINIDPNKTFENFIVGPSNNLAFATASAVADRPGKAGKYPCLYVYSHSGLGKTHLLHAVANQISSTNPELAIYLITARDFMKEMINAIKDKKIADFQKKYAEKIDVLMIDDIHELKNKVGTQEEFFHIFNELYNRGKQLIFTSDKAPKEIDGLEERIRTRLQWGLVVDIQKPDLETRIAILKKKALDLDLFLPNDVLNNIASNIQSSIRELEGSLIKLSAFSEVMGVEIDNVMVKQVLNLDMIEDQQIITLDSISKVVSQFYKIPIVDIKSKSRNKELVHARHVAMYMSKKKIDSTLKEIARFYGGRDHSTVIHGIDKITKLLKTNLELSKEVIQIENLL